MNQSGSAIAAVALMAAVAAATATATAGTSAQLQTPNDAVDGGPRGPRPTQWLALPAQLPNEPDAGAPAKKAGTCQPDNYIPSGRAEKKPRETIKTETPPRPDEEPPKELLALDKTKVVTAEPTSFGDYTLYDYEFGCEGGTDHVLDVWRSGKRYALYQNVWNYDLDRDKKLLFLHQSTRNKEGFRPFWGVVDLTTKRKTAIPPLGCPKRAFFSAGRLVGHADRYARDDELTDVCVWSLEGKPLAHLLVDLTWETNGGSGSDRYRMDDELGLLPNEPDTLYVLRSGRRWEAPTCELSLQSLTHAELSKSVDLGPVRDSKECTQHFKSQNPHLDAR
jgi:hypothetical protein